MGGFAVELAKADGLRVVADASPADEKLVTSLGADVVVPRGDDFGARVREVFPDGADGLVDGALLDEHALPAVRDGGRIATVRGYQGPDDDERGITFHPVFVRNYAREQAMLDRLRQQAEQGQVTLRVAQVLPAARPRKRIASSKQAAPAAASSSSSDRPGAVTQWHSPRYDGVRRPRGGTGPAR